MILASGGADGGFEGIHCRLDSERLSLKAGKDVIQELHGEGHDRALFVFSNSGRTHWHFVNVRFSGDEGRRRLYRREREGKPVVVVVLDNAAFQRAKEVVKEEERPGWEAKGL